MVRAHLDHIRELDGRIGAFQLVREERALEEAAAVQGRSDRASLPLAGVPVGVKDNIPVAGEPKRIGSAASSDEPQPEDDELVRRLRAAGAVIVGITRMPELGVFGTTDGAFGIARNPWDLERTPGGSSGGSAAAVAAAMVPVAHGNDGMGSIRIPAANCGLFGLKPGSGTVPRRDDATSWFGLTENGPLATTVDDAALLLSVLADRPDLCDPQPPEGPLRFAVSTKSPQAVLGADRHFRGAVFSTAELLRALGHEVIERDPPYSLRMGNAALATWFHGAEAELKDVDARKAEPRQRRHAAAARFTRRPFRSNVRERFRQQMGEFFEDVDVLLLPALARPAISAGPWATRGWVANMIANARYAPFAAAWNFAGLPAASIPAGRHPVGVPLAVQLVGPAGSEALILQVAKQLETERPWPRHAPIAGVD
ncbi:MAG TPA: amidase [Actinomycetota bacterium]|nr:amidase [Actinomycetota bacterium]